MILSKTIVALDQMSEEDIHRFLTLEENSIPIVKIGLELFLKHGPQFVKDIHQNYQKEIFLDLKLHDIPKTIERAIHSLEGLPVKFLTVHIGGGPEMLKATMAEAKRALPKTLILGVSFLTSLEQKDLNELYGITDLEEAFTRLFKIADSSGIDGVICSPHEIEIVKKIAPRLLAVTPGIRFQDEIEKNIIQDQKRVATPAKAVLMGADYIVMGRSLTKASNLRARLHELNV